MSFSKSPLSSHTRVLELARGGMGSVDVVLREEGDFTRLLAVKRLLPEFRGNDDFRQMFIDEARVAGLLRHPNIISVLDVGEDEEGPFLVMDFIEGLSISKLISMSARRHALLPVQLCARIVRDIAAGLHAAHELTSRDGLPLGLVHRDVTPQNVLLSYAGEVLVADFGIAKVMGQSNKTSTGVLKGKLGYMSPEQLRFREPDRRSDLFSLGVVFFELLAGRRAYSGKGMEAARKILEEPPPDILEVRDDVDDELTALLFELLAEQPEHRPQTADAVVKRLETVISQMVAEEDVLTLRTYLDEHFAGERESERTRLDVAIQAARVQSEIRRTKPESKDQEAKTVGEKSQKNRLLMPVLVGFVALGAIGVGAYVALAPSEPAPRAMPAAPTEPLIATPAPTPSAPPLALPVQPVEVAPDEDEQEEDAAAETAPVAPTMRRRRAARMNTMEEPSAEMTTTSMFAPWGAGAGDE